MKFYNKKLGTFSLTHYETYLQYVKVYPDTVPAPEYGLFVDIFRTMEEGY